MDIEKWVLLEMVLLGIPTVVVFLRNRPEMYRDFQLCDLPGLLFATAIFWMIHPALIMLLIVEWWWCRHPVAVGCPDEYEQADRV